MNILRRRERDGICSRRSSFHASSQHDNVKKWDCTLVQSLLVGYLNVDICASKRKTTVIPVSGIIIE